MPRPLATIAGATLGLLLLVFVDSAFAAQAKSLGELADNASSDVISAASKCFLAVLAVGAVIWFHKPARLAIVILTGFVLAPFAFAPASVGHVMSSVGLHFMGS